jgi:intracellular septation protein A
MNPRILLTLIPIAVFYALFRLDAPTWVAIGGGFAASAAVLLTNRSDRLIGGLTLFGFSILAITAVIGIIWGSEKAYLASGPISDFLFAPLYLVSILIGKPLIGGIAREMFPAYVAGLPPDHRVFVLLSLLWAGYDIIHGLARVYMLSNLSVGEYLIWSRLAAWPVSSALLAFSAWLILRETKRASMVQQSTAAAEGPA